MTDEVPISPADVAAQNNMVQSALKSSVARLYANGFLLAQTASDLSLILMTNGQPNGILSMSYISAKSLALQLEAIVQSFEKTTGQSVLTINQVGDALKNAQGPGIDLA